MEEKNNEGGKYLENVNSFFCGGEEKRRGKKRKTFGEGKYLILEEKENGEGKGGKYVKKEILFLVKAKKNGEGKGGNDLKKEINGDANRPTNMAGLPEG